MKTTYKKIIVLLLLLTFLAPLAVLAQSDIVNNLTNAAIQAGLNTSQKDLVVLIGQIVKIFLGFLGVIFVLLILYAGFTWMTAAGDDDKVKKARTLIVQATIGVLIVLAAYVISYYVITSIQSAVSGTGGTG